MDPLSKSVGRVSDIFASERGADFNKWLSKNCGPEWVAEMATLESALMDKAVNKAYADWVDSKFTLFIATNPLSND